VKEQLLADWATQGYTFPALVRRIVLDPGFYRVTNPQTNSSVAKNTAAE
jgi:hypothetical protein